MLLDVAQRLRTSVGDVITRPARSKRAPAAEAASLLWRRCVGAVPVTRHGALVGILTVSDFLYWIVSRD